MKRWDKVRVKGSKQEGVVVSTRLVQASHTERGNFGRVMLVKVDFGTNVIEYEQMELRLIKSD